MPITRRQSGKLPAPRFFEYRDPDLEASQLNAIRVEELWMSDLTDISDGEDEEQKVGVHAPGAAGEVPTQMKVCASEASVQNVKIMYPRRSGLEALPLGVLDEIFACLSPEDLLTLADTGGLITEFLNSSKAWRTWKVARTHFEPRPPEGPPSLSEIKYADLLWGKTCHGCRVKGSGHRTLYALFRRFCSDCFDDLVLSWDGISYIDCPQQILLLAPCQVDETSETRVVYYLKSDLVSIHCQIMNIPWKGPGSGESIDSWKGVFLAERAARIEFAAECEKWRSEIAKAEQLKLRARADEIRLILVPQFLAFGHHEVDVQAVCYDLINWRCGKLVRVFNNVGDTDTFMQAIIPRIEHHKTLREEHEKHQVQSGREKTLLRAFLKCVSFLTPRDWLFVCTHLKNHTIVQALKHAVPSIGEIISSPPRRDVTESDFNSGIARYIHLAKSLDPLAIHGEFLERYPPFKSDSVVSSSGNTLDSANSHHAEPLITFEAYHCTKCPLRPWGLGPLLFGMAHALLHRHGFDSLQQSQHASGAIRSLAEVLELEGNVTVERLDEVDKRFLCAECPYRYENGVFGLEAFCWRQAVEHICDKQHRVPSWYLLSSKEVEEIKAREKVEGGEDIRGVWQCNHCLPPSDIEHSLPDPLSKVAMEQHIVQSHCRYPKDVEEGEDYFFDPRFGECWVFRKPIFFPHDPRGTVTGISTSNSSNPEEILTPPDLPPPFPLLSSAKDNVKFQSLDEDGERYECLVCTKPKRKRAKSGFSLIGIKSHLKLKHQVQLAVEKRDYILCAS